MSVNHVTSMSPWVLFSSASLAPCARQTKKTKVRQLEGRLGERLQKLSMLVRNAMYRSLPAVRAAHDAHQHHRVILSAQHRDEDIRQDKI